MTICPPFTAHIVVPAYIVTRMVTLCADLVHSTDALVDIKYILIKPNLIGQHPVDCVTLLNMYLFITNSTRVLTESMSHAFLLHRL